MHPITGDSDTDYSTWEPLCDQREFEELMHQTVTEEAPRLFAVVQVLGERLDGRIAGWGLAFKDRVEVISAETGSRLTLVSAERAARLFARRATPQRPQIYTHVMWATTTLPSACDRPHSTVE